MFEKANWKSIDRYVLDLFLEAMETKLKKIQIKNLNLTSEDISMKIPNNWMVLWKFNKTREMKNVSDLRNVTFEESSEHERFLRSSWQASINQTFLKPLEEKWRKTF